MSEFQAFPKIPRLRRDVVITEKIDGTNAAVVVTDLSQVALPYVPSKYEWLVTVDGSLYTVAAQSRNRLITPDADNADFAAFVRDNAQPLAARLGHGYHYGEWWGQKIGRNYGLKEKRFSLFNVKRWGFLNENDLARWPELPQVDAVPLIGTGVLSDNLIEWALNELRTNGSFAAPGFQRPEGIVVFHTASGQLYKVLLENDELPKGLVTAAEAGVTYAG